MVNVSNGKIMITKRYVKYDSLLEIVLQTIQSLNISTYVLKIWCIVILILQITIATKESSGKMNFYEINVISR